MITVAARFVAWFAGAALLVYGCSLYDYRLALMVGGALLIYESKDGIDADKNAPEG